MPTTRRPFDSGYPVYRGGNDSNPSNLLHPFTQADRRVDGSWLDHFFFVFAGLASAWLVIVALVDAVQHSWWGILLALVFWGIAAYMTLPRLHRILTTLYVPSYFIGRTRTNDGLLGDPVNLAFQGESVDIHRAMKNAGWHKAEPVTLASSWRIIIRTIRRLPYPTAPVSPLFLFNRKEDFAYQQEVDGSPSKRHHIRFWKTPADWKLPGGAEVDWLAAATYDRSVGLSLFTFQVTHKIDADTDKERDYVVDTVRYCHPSSTTLDVIKDFSTGYHSRNGGGDNIITDGHLPILDVHDVVEEAMEIHDHHEESRYSYHRTPWQLAEQAPLSVWAAAACVGVLALIQLGLGLLHLPDYTASSLNLLGDRDVALADFTDQYAGITLIGALVTLALVQVILSAAVIRGRRRARKVLLALLSVSFVINAITVFTGQASVSTLYAVYVLMAVHVFALIEFTDDGAVNYTHNATETRRGRRQQKGNSSS